MTTRTRRFLAPFAAATLAATCAFAAPAAATSTPAPEPTVSTAVEAPSPADELDAGYTSLTGALMSMYAKQSGQTLGTYLKANDVMVAAAGNSTSSKPVGALVNGSTGAAGAISIDAESVGDLDKTLAANGFGLDMRNYNSLQDMATDVVAKAHTADGRVTLAGAQWVSQLGSLRVPELTTPTVGGATMPGIPSEALPFGLLLDQSIAGTVLNAPDLFAAAASSGVGSAELSKVFSGQMLDAWQKSNESLTGALPNKCTGAMLSVMASGDQKSAKDYTGCDPACTTGGLYLNSQVSRMFAPDGKQLSPNATDQLWNYETLLQAQDWRTQDLLEQNPSLVQGLLSDDGTAGGAMMCKAASTSTSQILSDTLVGVFGSLRTQ